MADADGGVAAGIGHGRCGACNNECDGGERDGWDGVWVPDYGDEFADELWSDGIAGRAERQYQHRAHFRNAERCGYVKRDAKCDERNRNGQRGTDSDHSQCGAQAQLSITPSSVIFGNVNVGSNSSKSVTLTNTGNATLNITAATISSAGYTTTLQPTSISAGANTTFTVTFAPTASGSASGSISITSNAPGSPSTIALSSTGLRAQIAATPSSVAFGTVTVGNTDSQPITLKNNGNTTLTFSQINVTGAGFGQTGLSTSTTIAAGATASFSATFDPSSSGSVSGSIARRPMGRLRRW